MSSAFLPRLARLALEEARRARRDLRAPGHRGPYYVSYLIRDVERFHLEARSGALHAEEHGRSRTCFADVRVGSYRYDQVHEGGLYDNDVKLESYGHSLLPIGDSPSGLRHALWRLTECRYREAVEQMLEKEAEALHFRDPNAELNAFQKHRAITHHDRSTFPEMDVDAYRDYVERASAATRRHRRVYNCQVKLHVRNVSRIFVNTEGSSILEKRPYWELLVNLDLDAESGIQVPWTLHRFVTDPAELPSLDALRTEIGRAVRTMEALADAPTVRAYSGPVWLDPQPAGLFIHEALGHRLEGNRLLARGEGQTFRDSLGEELLPSFLSLYDDPRLDRFGGSTLVGHFLYDDEGVPADRARMVERGRIKGFLSSRAGIAPRHRSNGHARNDTFERPMSRMAVTCLEADGGLRRAALKRRLIDEIRRRNLPYGIHVLSAEGGESGTTVYDFQAFQGEIRLATRVFPDGHEEPIRGVNFVGTPLNALRGIIAAGDTYEVDNSHCGAESGWVPVSTVSPALLLSDLELSARPKNPAASFTYPMP